MFDCVTIHFNTDFEPLTQCNIGSLLKNFFRNSWQSSGDAITHIDRIRWLSIKNNSFNVSPPKEITRSQIRKILRPSDITVASYPALVSSVSRPSASTVLKTHSWCWRGSPGGEAAFSPFLSLLSFFILLTYLRRLRSETRGRETDGKRARASKSTFSTIDWVRIKIKTLFPWSFLPSFYTVENK